MKKNDFSLIREIYSLPQGDIAVDFGLSQQTYAKYETGKTQRIPIEFITAFAARFHVNLAWFQSGTVTDRMRKDVKFAIKLLKDPYDATKRLNVPIAFLGAIGEGKVIPSEEFLDRVNKEYLKAKEEIVAKDEITGETTHIPEDGYPKIIFDLQAENRRLTQTIDHLNKYISLLEEKQGK
ncbi:MAG: helix-turn-helix transcriptional regulator [Chitinispirillia bacterium]|nr:helix-turn-helix transcriptional regulator [Chitinispirillia bacterium]MCL2268581.1 helix-turn-helix transcriptional regulator [Chitinispirillia bacterium]